MKNLQRKNQFLHLPAILLLFLTTTEFRNFKTIVFFFQMFGDVDFNTIVQNSKPDSPSYDICITKT